MKRIRFGGAVTTLLIVLGCANRPIAGNFRAYMERFNESLHLFLGEQAVAHFNEKIRSGFLENSIEQVTPPKWNGAIRSERHPANPHVLVLSEGTGRYEGRKCDIRNRNGVEAISRLLRENNISWNPGYLQIWRRCDNDTAQVVVHDPATSNHDIMLRGGEIILLPPQPRISRFVNQLDPLIMEMWITGAIDFDQYASLILERQRSGPF